MYLQTGKIYVELLKGMYIDINGSLPQILRQHRRQELSSIPILMVFLKTVLPQL